MRAGCSSSLSRPPSRGSTFPSSPRRGPGQDHHHKTIILCVLDLDDMQVETPEAVAARIRSALRFVFPQRLLLAPDCGMKYLPRDVAFAKLQSLVAGASIVRRELA